jgi:hypothetical protein
MISMELGNREQSIYNVGMSALTNTLIEEIKAAPEPLQREVFNFLVFLKTRQAAREEGRENLLPLAQTAWANDWDSVEEDEAWRDL